MESRCLPNVGELLPYCDGVTFHQTELCTATQLCSLCCLHATPTNVPLQCLIQTTSLCQQPAQTLSASKCTLSAHTDCHKSQQLWLTLMTAQLTQLTSEYSMTFLLKVQHQICYYCSLLHNSTASHTHTHTHTQNMRSIPKYYVQGWAMKRENFKSLKKIDT